MELNQDIARAYIRQLFGTATPEEIELVEDYLADDGSVSAIKAGYRLRDLAGTPNLASNGPGAFMALFRAQALAVPRCVDRLVAEGFLL